MMKPRNGLAEREWATLSDDSKESPEMSTISAKINDVGGGGGGGSIPRNRSCFNKITDNQNFAFGYACSVDCCYTGRIPTWRSGKSSGTTPKELGSIVGRIVHGTTSGRKYQH
ncbi:hypothetical protein LOAG_14045 [Loa loa]|uniref:Uncharacterized protein n=1 Tax=Loa loa TaxID=7209 RepID=A0A1S0TJE1_LOALO|nr:hypothetical protein LOAG_14045 [Loa loa]EFO14476.1 hypothetical protein LOAG_14045 [Loa loa]